MPSPSLPLSRDRIFSSSWTWWEKGSGFRLDPAGSGNLDPTAAGIRESVTVDGSPSNSPDSFGNWKRRSRYAFRMNGPG